MVNINRVACDIKKYTHQLQTHDNNSILLLGNWNGHQKRSSALSHVDAPWADWTRGR